MFSCAPRRPQTMQRAANPTEVQDNHTATPDTLLRMPLTSTEPAPSTAHALTSQLEQPLPQPQHKPKRRHRPKTTVTDLSPVPAQLAYTDYGYYALAALCRERRLPSGDTAPVLRNRLIKDDTDAAQGIPMATKRHKCASRKVYKHGVPSEVSGGGGSRSADESEVSKG
jgi:hypothetical protein